MPEPRSAQAVIDQAIRENKPGERLLYCFSAGVCSAGLFGIIWGAVHNQPVIALAGSIPTAMLWPAMHFAHNIRKQNLALRLLEVPIAKATTATGAAEMLRDVFVKTFLGQGKALSPLESPAVQQMGASGGGGNA